MTDEAEYEEYRNTLSEIVDGGGCVETMTAASDLREEGSPSRRDLLGSDALATGVAESVDDVVAEVDADAAREQLKADYADLDDVRAAFEETVDGALFDALADTGAAVSTPLSLDPAVCLKTFAEADLDTAMTLVPEVRPGGVVGRIVAREDGVTIHAVPADGRSYAVVGREDGEPGRLLLPDGTVIDCAGADEHATGLDCDPERAARTEYVQTTVDVDGETYVVETVCTTV